jgi:hypothetical protein
MSARSLANRAGSVRSGVGAEQDSGATLLRKIRSPRKYRNEPTTVDGQRFDSKKEAERYGQLRLMEQAGEISDLLVHPSFPLVVHGQSCGDYIADFGYIRDGQTVVEDVKSAATRKLPVYRLKARLVWALYGLRIREV